MRRGCTQPSGIAAPIHGGAMTRRWVGPVLVVLALLVLLAAMQGLAGGLPEWVVR